MSDHQHLFDQLQDGLDRSMEKLLIRSNAEQFLRMAHAAPGNDPARFLATCAAVADANWTKEKLAHEDALKSHEATLKVFEAVLALTQKLDRTIHLYRVFIVSVFISFVVGYFI